eukprot:CAMPEP_0198309536 /NCGR_PEP_ID=MMETSP1450-20131203/1907_1 /TAXON_ID=753684 ORGANISM="Madagascaria erythrocladiodes, Strain CCMP3234" /NCGR_SAMPLE_ID=MMETSP1450 /ASSEMBLY_ACC=CAM_ASM_001115 /LENGTH=192 /DNA_ID=CAMNT_0044012297 /DNA_START=380 /DNA_END=959 /DNA_ORIENTATION=-
MAAGAGDYSSALASNVMASAAASVCACASGVDRGGRGKNLAEQLGTTGSEANELYHVRTPRGVVVMRSIFGVHRSFRNVEEEHGAAEGLYKIGQVRLIAPERGEFIQFALVATSLMLSLPLLVVWPMVVRANRSDLYWSVMGTRASCDVDLDEELYQLAGHLAWLTRSADLVGEGLEACLKLTGDSWAVQER